MKYQINIIAMFALLIIASIASANLTSIAEVTFDKPESFNDFKTQTSHNDIDKSRLMQELQEQINGAANRLLSTGHQLKINFLNIDMAGHIYPSIDDIRTIRRDADKSLLVFEYTVLDSNGKVLDHGNEKLLALHFNAMKHEAKKFKRSHFKFEMVMLSRWLKKLSKTLSTAG